MKTKYKWVIEQIIQEEFAACEAAWKACPEAKWAWCGDPDDARVGPQIEPWTNLLSYIRYGNPSWQWSERVARIRNFRPVRVAVPPKLENAEYKKACDKWNKPYAEERTKVCADWDKVCAEWAKVCVEWANENHDKDWPDNTYKTHNKDWIILRTAL